MPIQCILEGCNLANNFILDDVLSRVIDNGSKHDESYGERTPYRDYVSLRASVDRPGNSYLVMDDVTTSGSSMIAATQLLMNAGAKQVVCLAVAKTISW